MSDVEHCPFPAYRYRTFRFRGNTMEAIRKNLLSGERIVSIYPVDLSTGVTCNSIYIEAMEVLVERV